MPPSKCEDCALKRPVFGLPAEGKARWCAGCARGHGGAQNLKSRRCEGCKLKVPNFGLPAEGKARWCGGCACGHDGAINVRTKRPPLVKKRPRASTAAAPSPSRKGGRGLTAVEPLPSMDDGAGQRQWRAGMASDFVHPNAHGHARSLEADGLQLLVNGARDLATMLTRPGVPHAGAA